MTKSAKPRSEKAVKIYTQNSTLPLPFKYIECLNLLFYLKNKFHDPNYIYNQTPKSAKLWSEKAVRMDTQNSTFPRPFKYIECLNLLFIPKNEFHGPNYLDNKFCKIVVREGCMTFVSIWTIQALCASVGAAQCCHIILVHGTVRNGNSYRHFKNFFAIFINANLVIGRAPFPICYY